MRKVVIFAALTALLFLFTPINVAQDADEVVKLRRENDLLKKQIELLKHEIELLKKESNAQSERTGSSKAGARELEPLQGTWNIDSMEMGGKSLP